MRVTCQQIAKRLNVSTATVSRVLSGTTDSFISQATRERVLTAAREMGYQTNRAARSLVTGRTQLIAYWMPLLSEAFYVQTIQHVQRQVKAHDYELLVTEMGSHHEWRSDQSRLVQWPVDGILALNFLAPESVMRQAIGNTPCVCLGPFYNRSLNYVGIDLFAPAQDATRHLIATGRKRIAFVTLDRANHPGDDRHAAYTQTLEEAGYAPEYISVPGTTREIARAVIREYYEDRPLAQLPDALFCRNDEKAIGAYRGLRDLGIRVPEDVAIVGCDGIQDTEYLDVPISTIRQPTAEMCAIGWLYLGRALREPEAPVQQTVLRATLEVRASSRG